jgi:transcriptional regulator with XRE-family HTH domain
MEKNIRQTDKRDEIIGLELRRQRLARGMSQEKMGEEVKLTFQQIQKYEKGSNRIGAVRLYDLSKILGVDIGVFYRRIDREYTQNIGKDPFENLSLKPADIDLMENINKLSSKEKTAVKRLISTLAGRNGGDN